ncbi:hypothetical protein L2449_27350 [Mesorhizobium muleiense]|uniref:hypothetical protein n=1 Tax=Mesorhizobium muleiense TaxID=1004279 RepID=UPI001F30DA0E|nr:hypothetical protein [Mesorhizobium muleiense]MCF6120545.1 hypothetical protein [Mesorhizobium muleiense]
MSATPYPLPRETRESAILVGNGTVGPYGPSLYKVFDILDVAVFTRAAGEDVFSDVTDQVTVTKTAAAGYDTFSVTFDAAVPVSTQWYHQARRVAERSVAVTKAGTVDSNQLEKELSKQATTQSEVRRDVDRTYKAQVDVDPGVIVPGAAGELMQSDAGGNLVGSGENVSSILGSTAAALASANAAAADAGAADADRIAVEAVLATAGVLIGSGAADWTSIGGILRTNKAELADFGRLVTRYGALHDNVFNDGAAGKLAEAAGAGTIVFPDGTYRMQPTDASTFTLGNQPNNVYRSIPILTNDLSFFGFGGIIRPVSRAGVIAADVQPAFSTLKNLVVGAIKNLKFLGLSFDSNNDGDAVNSNQRMAYLVGVDGLRQLMTRFFSSGARRGYGQHIQNSRNIQIIGHLLQKVTGGHNIRYCKNFILTNFIYENFSEGIDLDGWSERVVIRHGVFEGITRTVQCIDINDQIDASIGDFSVYLVGNIATINYKTTTPDTYTEYVNNSPVRNFQLSKRIVLSNISGSAIGDGVLPSYYVGWDWSAGNHAGAGPVSEITLENIKHDDVSFISVLECKNLVLRNITLLRALSSAGFAAVDLRSSGANADQIGWSDLDVEIDGLRVENAQRGALKISTASRVKLRGLVTRGNNTLGGADADLNFQSMNQRAGFADIDDCDIEGGVTLGGDSTAIPAWAAGTLYKRNALVTNGGSYYRAIAEGLSAAVGGPAGTGLSIADDGTAAIAAWAGSTLYAVDNMVSNGGAYFICMTAGISAAAGGPAGTDHRIYDGAAVWRPISGIVRWEYLLMPYAVRWGKKMRVRGAITLNGDVQKFIFSEKANARIGDVVAAGSFTWTVLPMRRPGLVLAVNYTVGTDIAADAVNYRSLLVRRMRAGVALTIGTIDTQAGLTANVQKDGGITAILTTNAALEPGDTVVITSNSAGAGKALNGLVVTVDYLER